MLVTRREFDRTVERVRAGVGNPAHGLYGPGSITWRVCRESVVFLGAGRAALMQLAHPYVAHAIAQHSDTIRDPIGRFNRTFQAIYSIIFGDLDAAMGAAERVRAIHDRINGAVDEDVGRFARGHSYTAHESSALLWVHATLVETAIMAFEMGFGPLSADEKEAYYQELGRTAALFGLAESMMPPSFPAFQAYCAAMVAGDEIAVGEPARRIARFLLVPSSPLLRPAVAWYTTLTAGMLPPRLRDGFGLRFSPADQRVYEASLRALRRGWPHIPARLRHRPEYTEALSRLSGKPSPDRVGRALEQLVLYAVRPRAVEA
jgi:uncharacterized protein (DUF2236 family)